MHNIEDILIVYLRGALIKWGRNNFSDFPWRRTKNRWHALTAEIMLQRTKAEQVLPVYEDFCAKYKSPSGFLKDGGHSTFQNLGLGWREKKFRKLVGILSQKEIPGEKKELLELPGIGNYIASAYRSLHLNMRDCIIDSNIVRLYGRFFGFETDGETRRKSWFMELSESITPLRAFKDFNYGLIDFTRAICKPKPLCDKCAIKGKCYYYEQKSLRTSIRK